MRPEKLIDINVKRYLNCRHYEKDALSPATLIDCHPHSTESSQDTLLSYNSSSTVILIRLKAIKLLSCLTTLHRLSSSFD